jgi:hypothetical protein
MDSKPALHKSGVQAGLFCCKMSISELEAVMQKWPYADLGHVNVEHFRFKPQSNHSAQKREYLTVETVTVSENAVILCNEFRVGRAPPLAPRLSLERCPSQGYARGHCFGDVL